MSLADGAVALAQAGWKVFPVSASTKRPRTPHGHLDASSDPLVVAGWAGLFDSGGAIATPTGDGLLVVDIDPRNGGRVPTWALEIPTRTVRTQSGGLHLHYAIDRDIKSRAGLFGPGVDSKSAGGYVLIPPSPGYQWVDARVSRALLTADWLERHFVAPQGGWIGGGSDRLDPARWYHGVIHTQVMSWAGYFAAVLDDVSEVEGELWRLVARAKDAGVQIDDEQIKRDVRGAVRWVTEREAAKAGPSLA